MDDSTIPHKQWWMIPRTITNSDGWFHQPPQTDGRFHQPPTKWWMIQSTTTNSDGWLHRPSQTVMEDSTNQHIQWWRIPPTTTNIDRQFCQPPQSVMVDSTIQMNWLDKKKQKIKNKTLSYPDHVFLTLTFYLSLMMQRKWVYMTISEYWWRFPEHKPTELLSMSKNGR